FTQRSAPQRARDDAREHVGGQHHDLFLRREVVEEGPLGDACTRGDVGGRGRVVPALGGQPGCRRPGGAGGGPLARLPLRERAGSRLRTVGTNSGLHSDLESYALNTTDLRIAGGKSPFFACSPLKLSVRCIPSDRAAQPAPGGGVIAMASTYRTASMRRWT